MLGMYALYQLGVKVVSRLSLRDKSEEERADRIGRFSSTLLSRTLLVLYIVYPGAHTCQLEARLQTAALLLTRPPHARRSFGCRVLDLLMHDARERRGVPGRGREHRVLRQEALEVRRPGCQQKPQAGLTRKPLVFADTWELP